MKLKAFDKNAGSTGTIMTANQHRAESGYYCVEKMHKSDEMSANIPLECVAVPGVKRRHSSGQSQAKYIQCILPFICILQVISIVSVSVCFFLYKATLDECTSLQKDMLHMQYDYKMDLTQLRNEYRADIVKLRDEIEANVTAQIRDLQHVSKNVSTFSLKKIPLLNK